MVFIVIPVYNEAGVIKMTLRDLLPLGHQIVLVDDGSNDQLKESISPIPVHYLRHITNLGQGAALATGIKYAVEKGATEIVTFDADGQHCADDIPRLLAFLKHSGADIIFGSRFLENAYTNVRFPRYCMIQMARVINFLFTGVLLSDAHNGIRAFTRAFGEALQITENGMAHASEFLFFTRKSGFKYAEFPVTVMYTDYSRLKGQKSLHGLKILQDLVLYKLFK